MLSPKCEIGMLEAITVVYSLSCVLCELPLHFSMGTMAIDGESILMMKEKLIHTPSVYKSPLALCYSRACVTVVDYCVCAMLEITLFLLHSVS